MKMIKMVMVSLISLAMTQAFAEITLPSNQYKLYKIKKWKFETEDEGRWFILGKYSKKLLVLHSNETTKDGMPTDVVTILCQGLDDEKYNSHRLEPGSSLTCQGSFQDISYMYITPEDFKNGGEGTYEFQPIDE